VDVKKSYQRPNEDSVRLEKTSYLAGLKNKFLGRDSSNTSRSIAPKQFGFGKSISNKSPKKGASVKRATVVIRKSGNQDSTVEDRIKNIA
jgi:hypothetical protein